ncbi:MAG: hypothetical protein JSV04_01710 [Candidatus Heimdallarchaeota archaeon]|nr:MAG: hypothetical protein JSV04_01710 [Candidatus Heimdallarchaeota archaeon]
MSLNDFWGEKNKEFLVPFISSVLGIIGLLILPYVFWEEQLMYSYDYTLFPYGLQGRSFHFMEAPAAFIPIIYFLLVVVAVLAVTAYVTFLGFRINDKFPRQYIDQMILVSGIITTGMVIAPLYMIMVFLNGVPIWNTGYGGGLLNWVLIGALFIWIVPLVNTLFFLRLKSS